MRLEDPSASWVASLDWAALARTVAELPKLQRITVEVKKSSEEYCAYTQHAHHYLESIACERGITLCVGNS